MNKLELTKEINKLKSLRTFLWKGNKAKRRAILQSEIDFLETVKTMYY